MTMQPISTSAKGVAAGAGRGIAASTSCVFAYEHCDVEPGVTLAEWRRARTAPRRRSVWQRVRRVAPR
jgi:hypothetical protein